MSSESRVSRRRPSAVVLIALGACALVIGSTVVLEVNKTLRERRTIACTLNVTLLTRALQTYLTDNDEVFPPGARWSDLLAGYVEGREHFTCPEAHNKVCSYAFNGALSEAPRPAVADWSDVIAVFESDAGWNAFGGAELLPPEPRHFGGDQVGFAGSAEGWRRRLKGPARGSHTVWLKEYEPRWLWRPSPRQ